MLALVKTESPDRVSARAVRQMTRFLRWLADTPDAVALDRYREAQSEDEPDGIRRCIGCGHDEARLNARGLCKECAS